MMKEKCTACCKKDTLACYGYELILICREHPFLKQQIKFIEGKFLFNYNTNAMKLGLQNVQRLAKVHERKRRNKEKVDQHDEAEIVYVIAYELPFILLTILSGKQRGKIK